MKPFMLLILLSVSVSVANASTHSLDFRSSTSTSPDPLSTEDFQVYDPGVLNPHLQRWALERSVELMGLVAVKVSARIQGEIVSTYKVTAQALDTQSMIHLRADGPWYQSLEQFPCKERLPSPEFSTLEGARNTATAAAKIWNDILVDKKGQLEKNLSRVTLTSSAEALDAGQRVFKEWLGSVDAQWRARVASEAVYAQWRADRKQADSRGFCKEGSRANATEIWPDTWAEAAASEPASQPIFRAPAHRVGGYFTIRLELRVGFRSVSGEFLIDPGSPTSVISPSWLLAQGLPPMWVEIPEALPTPVRVHAGDGADGLAKMAFFDQVTASGYTLGIQRFQVFDVSTLFDEPGSPTSCCSGVLGQDFLSRYVLEFHPESPMEVLAWPVKAYAPKPSSKALAKGLDEYQWVELRRIAAADRNEHFITACSPRVRALGSSKYSAKLCQDPVEGLKASVGSMVFDLPHGRLWYSQDELSAPVYKNLSGLGLDFVYENKNRVLVVESMGKTTAVQTLMRAGLRKGDTILSIDGVPSSSLSLWEIRRRLSGVYGDQVLITWKNQKTRSSAHAVFSARAATATSRPLE
jgi:hypothetical protein